MELGWTTAGNNSTSDPLGHAVFPICLYGKNGICQYSVKTQGAISMKSDEES
jgi:hypothetical protein